MTNRNKTDQLTSVTTTTETTREETQTSAEALTPREEKVLRMLHGMSEDDSRAIQFGLGADEDTLLKLAMIEQQMIDCISSGVEEEDSGRVSPAELLSSWLDKN